MPRNYQRGGGKTKRKNHSAAKHEPKIKQAERAKLILQWRIAGWTYDQIAEALPGAGFSKLTVPTVHGIVKKEITDRKAAFAEDVLQLELFRLDAMMQSFYEKATADPADAFAVGVVLQIMDRRARYLGLYAPERVEEVGGVADAKAGLMAKLGKMAQRTRNLDPPAVERDDSQTLDAPSGAPS